MSSSDESDEMPSGFGWADQVASFPPRTASTEEVQQWLEFFLEQRAFDSEEFHIFLNQVRLNGEELHSLSKTKLQKKLPKVPDYGGGFVLEDDLSYYHFEQMLETIFTDIIRARKESGIVVPKGKAKSTHGGYESGILLTLLCSALFCTLGVCCVFWIL
ncbi:hypothetical protein PG999_011460 [Apiospora kogelbergensis]|uniref:PNT domain-containing protein n=1 Tax=Apiospora kogelbergensis TaxID=1337665 RepID=A0AAW0QFG2_9PEZI